MPEYGVSLTRFFPYNNRIYHAGNASQKKNPYSDIFYIVMAFYYGNRPVQIQHSPKNKHCLIFL